MRYVHYLPGGGLGDVYREAYFHNALGILKRWRVLHPQDTLRVLLMSHNPSSIDWLAHQDWIDESVQLEFPLERTWAWESCYKLYPEQFEGHTELRFHLPVFESLYRSDLSVLRPKITDIQTIPAIGSANAIKLGPFETERTNTLVWHPHAGEKARCMSPEVCEAVRHAVGAFGFPYQTGLLCVGADYNRMNHGSEIGVETLGPRQLAATIAASRGVIATESSVYYIAAMLGIPFVMLYHPQATYAQVKAGKSTWAWFFGEADSRSRFLSLDTDPTTLQQELTAWLHALPLNRRS